MAKPEERKASCAVMPVPAGQEAAGSPGGSPPVNASGQGAYNQSVSRQDHPGDASARSGDLDHNISLAELLGEDI